MNTDATIETETIENVIDEILKINMKLENEIYELDSAINIAKEYAKDKDLNFMRYLNILKEKCGKIKRIISAPENSLNKT